MTTHESGKRHWIEARAAVLVRLRRMSPADAKAKAAAEMKAYVKADAKRDVSN